MVFLFLDFQSVFQSSFFEQLLPDSNPSPAVSLDPLSPSVLHYQEASDVFFLPSYCQFCCGYPREGKDRPSGFSPSSVISKTSLPNLSIHSRDFVGILILPPSSSLASFGFSSSSFMKFGSTRRFCFFSLFWPV